MLRKLLAVAPLLLALPVAAAPQLIPCSSALAAEAAVTQTQPELVSATVIPDATASAKRAQSEKYSPVATSASVPDASNSSDTSQAAPSAEAPQDPVAEGITNGANIPARSGSYENTLYFTNWGIYGANFQPQQLPAKQITRVLYSFADIASDGTVKSSDTYADLEKHYSTDSWNDQGKNAYGCVKQLFLLKKKNRQLKVLLSIGGWTYSPKFAPVAASAAARQKFAASSVKLVADWGLDGIDIDWEYPASKAEAQNFIKLLQTCRKALDDYSKKYAGGYHFLITVASPAGPTNYNMMDMRGMDPYVDSWNLMAYDYAGSWDSTSGHQANIFNNPQNPASTKFSTDKAVKDYLAKGIKAKKIMMGMPLYGRAFDNTKGLGQSYSGVGSGSSQAGIWLYKDLPRPGAQERYDNVAKMSYSYDAGKKELVSYDNVQSATQKAAYLAGKGLGGGVYWEASGDRTGAKSIVGTVAKKLGALGNSPNLLRYPQSQYANIKAGMPGA